MAQYFAPLSILVCLFWYIIICFLLTRSRFFKESGISKRWLLILYSLKVLAGFAYGIFYLQPSYFASSDTWNYFELSKAETDWLLRDPLAFFTDLFNYGYNRPGNLFLGVNSYWNDLKSNVIIKLIAITNVFTFKNYFANIFLFNFLFFYGTVAYYRLLGQLFHLNKAVIVFTAFLIPSFLFWCSGIHKDGIILTFTALVAWHFYKQLNNNKINPGSLLVSLASLLVVFSLRNFVALLLLPSLLVWGLCYYRPEKTIFWVALVYGLGLVLFFLSGKISSSTNFPQYIIGKQNEFAQLSGTSAIQVPPLENSVASFMAFLPTAVDIGFFRPHITEIRNLSYIPSVVEIFFLWGLVILSVAFNRRVAVGGAWKAYIVFALGFSVSFLILAGYTITFSGAIVRYRALAWPFIVSAFLPWINETMVKMTKLISNKKI